MTARQLPERANLEQLKRQAKDLLHEVRERSATAIARARTLPAFTVHADDHVAHAFALHDAQSVVAREYGFDSWNALREQVEAMTLDFGAAVDEFIAAATDGRRDRAERLLELHPGIAGANLYTALIVGNEAAANAHLTRDPALATAPGGPRGWQPLHYVCYTAVGARTPERERGLVAIARRLIALGADPDLRFPWRHHEVYRSVLWGAVSSIRSLPLARALLEAGANPDDGVSLTISASAGDIDALELLREFGADVDGPWGTDGSTALYAMLHWSENPAGARWLIEHGADADAVFAQNGETPLHLVAARWDTALAELLVQHGANIGRRRADRRTPYAVAVLSGNVAVAEWLRAHGAPTDVPEVDRLVSAGRRGDLAAVRTMLSARPSLGGDVGAEHYGALYDAAERNDVNAIEALLACGLDPNRGDESMDMNALHKASMAGWPEAVRVLLAHGASVDARDREFHATPLVAAAEGARHPREGRDHAAVGRLLLEAGSPLDWAESGEPSESILEIIDAWRAGSASGANGA